MMRMTAPFIAIALAFPAAALAQQDNMMSKPTEEYPRCSATVTDHCTETAHGTAPRKKAKAMHHRMASDDHKMSDAPQPDPK